MNSVENCVDYGAIWKPRPGRYCERMLDGMKLTAMYMVDSDTARAQSALCRRPALDEKIPPLVSLLGRAEDADIRAAKLKLLAVCLDDRDIGVLYNRVREQIDPRPECKPYATALSQVLEDCDVDRFD